MNSKNDATDDEIDQQLRQWRKTLSCDTERTAKMRSILLEQLGEIPVLPTSRPAVICSSNAGQRFKTVGYGVIVGVLMLMFFGLYVWFGFSSVDRRFVVSNEALIAKNNGTPDLIFTADELRQREQIICELQHVFEQQVHLIHHHDTSIELDIEPSAMEIASPKLVIRFVLQSRSANSEWQTKTPKKSLAAMIINSPCHKKRELRSNIGCTCFLMIPYGRKSKLKE